MARVSGEGVGKKGRFPSFPSPLFHFLPLVSFLARPKPRISFLRNSTETLATQANCGRSFALLHHFLSAKNDVAAQNVFLLTGTLQQLCRIATPKEFLALLPDDGCVGFFIPYIQQCYSRCASDSVSERLGTSSWQVVT